MVIKRRSDKCLKQLLNELSQSRLLSDNKIQIIEKCLSTQKFKHANLTETREAMIRITNNISGLVDVDDLNLVVGHLSYALHESMKYKPRLTQLISLCILLLSYSEKKNSLLEVLTGEGKSCIIAMFAAALGLQGRKVDIVTSSPVLAKRDAANWAKFYDMFEMNATHNTDTMELLTATQSKADMNRAVIYSHNVVYGTVSSFSADILREEFEMRKVRSDRGFQTIVIDEVDMLMMDEGVQFTYLSHRLALLRHIEPVFALVWSTVQQYSPMFTEDGDILFAEVAKNFHNTILDDIDTNQYPELEKVMDQFHEFSDKETAIEYLSTEKMLSLIKQVNASGASYVKAYILNDEGALMQGDYSESTTKEPEEHRLVLLSDRGKIHPLYTQEKLAEGVKGVVLSHCDISIQDILHTTDGAMYHPGYADVFDKVLSNLDSSCQPTLLVDIAQDKIKTVLKSANEKARMMTLEYVETKDMVQFIEQLNESQKACHVVAYTLDENCKMIQVVSSTDRHSNKIFVLIRDKGILHPLYTLDEANTSEKDILYTPDGDIFNRGEPDSLYEVICKCLDPLQLLDVVAKHGIIKDKIEMVLHTKDKELREKEIKSFCKFEILQIVDFLKCKLPCKIKAYTSVPHSLELEDSLSVLIMDEGKMCQLYGNHGTNVEGVSKDGNISQGPTDFFHNVICAGIDSQNLFQLLINLESQNDTNSTKQALPVLTYLEKLEKYLQFKLVVYTIDGKTQEPFTRNSTSTKGKSEKQLLLLENGLLCQLQKSEKIAVPNSLKDFVETQLPIYIDSAFTAHLMTENREYLVSSEGKILPINYQNSGIIEANKRWGGGLQQMLEMKHYLQLSPMSVITNFLSHVEFFTRYKEGTLFGLSGTIGGVSEFKVLKDLYKFDPCRIPTFCKRLLYERRPIFVEGERNDWLDKIHSVLKIATGPKSYMTPRLPGAAALVLCEDIRTAEEISQHLIEKGQKAVLYTRNDLKESELFEDKTRDSGDIIVATNLAGRGTDIKLTDGVNDSGGLFCLMTFLPRNRRVELQAFGRTARKGNPGSVQFILPGFASPDQQFNMNLLRKAREEMETNRLKCMLETEVKEVKLREELFHKHCKYLKNFYNDNKDRKEKQMNIDMINENWGQWLQTKQQAIISLQRENLLKELDAVHKRWRPCDPVSSSNPLLHLPVCNFHHLVKFGNANLFDLDSKEIIRNGPGVSEAHHYYTKAIEMESNFTMVAHYNRACCTITTANGDYITEGINDLTKAKESLGVYITEVNTVSQLQCITTNTLKHQDNHFNKQMEIRMQVLQHFEKQINETVEKLKEVKKKDGNAKVIPNSILEFIPEADIVTNEELYGLKLLGLEASFSVEFKAKFNWSAFGVFILGIGQIVVGVCITALTAGALSNFGIGLISEGVSDCIDGAIGMYTGEFDLKDWAISKACSIAVSVACGGVGKLIAKGTKGAVKAIRGGKTAVTQGIKATSSVVHQEVRVMGKVAQGSFKRTLNVCATGAKLVGKELILQGAMYGLKKVENLAIEEMCKLIGNKVAHSSDFLESLKKSFTSNGEDDLGQFFNQQLASFSEQEVQYFFASVTDEVITLLVQSESTVFDEITDIFIDKILPQLSEHSKEQKKKSAYVVLKVIEIGFMVKFASDCKTKLVCLTKQFQPKIIQQCKAHFEKSDDSQVIADSQATDELKNVKEPEIDTLVNQTADKFGEAVATVLLQNITWMMSRAMSATVNRVADKHMSKRLGIDRTKDKIKDHQKINYICYMPPGPPRKTKHFDAEHMKSLAKKLQSLDTPGTVAELKVVVEKLNCKVVIEDKDGNRIHSLESNSSLEKQPKVTLVHIPGDQGKTGHYDLKINGKITPIQSRDKNCMFEALAEGLKYHEKHAHLDGASIRKIVVTEVSNCPEIWHDHFKRQEQLQKVRNGKLLLLEGGQWSKSKASGSHNHKKVHKEKSKNNKSTAINSGTRSYAREMLDSTTESITYIQKNDLQVASFVKYDKEPVGKQMQRCIRFTPYKQTLTLVENNIGMKEMYVEAKNCNFHKNVGRCLQTLPSHQQLRYKGGHRPMGGSSPVSFHLVPSEAGANAGTHFGNSVVTSEDYNRKEALVRKQINNCVDRYYHGKKIKAEKRNFTLRVDVKFEDLIPSGGINEFVTRRNKVKKIKPVEGKNIAKLEERFKMVAARVYEKPGKSQVQRVKSMTYVLVLPNGKSIDFKLGCDTELYVHSELTGKSKGEDLAYAEPSRKQVLVARK